MIASVPDDEIKFQGAITQEQYRNALYLYSRRTAITVAVIVGIIGLTLLVRILLAGGGAFGGLLALLLPLIWVVGIFMIIRLQADRIWTSNKLIKEPFTGSASTVGIVMQSAHANAQLPWDAFYYSKTFPDAVLLLHGSQSFNLFVPAFFSSTEDWRRFSALVQQKTPDRPSRDWKSVTLLVCIWLIIVLLSAIYFAARRNQ